MLVRFIERLEGRRALDELIQSNRDRFEKTYMNITTNFETLQEKGSASTVEIIRGKPHNTVLPAFRLLFKPPAEPDAGKQHIFRVILGKSREQDLACISLECHEVHLDTIPQPYPWSPVGEEVYILRPHEPLKMVTEEGEKEFDWVEAGDALTLLEEVVQALPQAVIEP